VLIDVLKIFFLSASPIVEIRGALPVALVFYRFSFFWAFLICFLGNIFPVIFLLSILEKIFFYFSKFSFFEKILKWYLKRTNDKFSLYLKRWQKLALLVFVSLPFPFTGAWTGSMVAVLMGFNKKEAFILISGGIIISGLIVSLLVFLGRLTFNFVH
jgi:uncharacterized membrane protein